MAQVCLDTSAWLEYFNAGPHGPHIQGLVQQSERVVTPAPVAAELIEAARRRKLNSKMFLQFLRARSDVVSTNAEVARLAGRIGAKYGDLPGWTLLESLVLATADYTRTRLVTRDPIYEGIRNVTVLPPSRAAALGGTASGTTGPA